MYICSNSKHFLIMNSTTVLFSYLFVCFPSFNSIAVYFFFLELFSVLARLQRESKYRRQIICYITISHTIELEISYPTFLTCETNFKTLKGRGGAGQGRAGQGRAGQGRVGQGRAGQGRAGQGRAGQGRAGQGRAEILRDRGTCIVRMDFLRRNEQVLQI